MSEFELDKQHSYPPVISQEDISRFEHPEKPTESDIDYYKHNVMPNLYQLSSMIMRHRPERVIYNFLGLTEAKFNLYKKWFPDFRNAIVQGKQAGIQEMEEALKKVGLGIDYEESEIVNVYEPGDEIDPKTGQPKMKLVQKKERITKKYTPPNVRAIEMYLTNRSPENWKRSQPDNITQNNTATVINVSEEQVKGMIEKLQGSFLVDTKVQDAEVVDG